MAKRFYEILEHTADIRIRVSAKELKDLFSRTAAAMFDIIAEKKPGPNAEKKELTIAQEAPNLEELFINWLNELLSLSSVRGLIFSYFQIKTLDEKHLEAVVWGEKAKNDNINKEIKAATYHQLQVIKNRNGWKTEVIFDV